MPPRERAKVQFWVNCSFKGDTTACFWCLYIKKQKHFDQLYSLPLHPFCSVFTTPSFLPPSFVSLISSPLFHPPPYLLQLPKESPVNSEREGKRGRQVGSVSSAASRPGRSSVAARLGSGGQAVGGTRQGPAEFRPLKPLQKNKKNKEQTSFWVLSEKAACVDGAAGGNDW